MHFDLHTDKQYRARCRYGSSNIQLSRLSKEPSTALHCWLTLNITCANPNGPHMFNHAQDTVHHFFGIVNGFHSLEVARIYPVYPDIQFKQHGI